jgi:4-hydroxybenzoate polyprenyltransferase
LYNASKYTYNEVRIFGIVQIVLGLIGCWFVAYGLLLWAAGFGIVHIIYGIYIHFKYER